MMYCRRVLFGPIFCRTVVRAPMGCVKVGLGQMVSCVHLTENTEKTITGGCSPSKKKLHHLLTRSTGPLQRGIITGTGYLVSHRQVHPWNMRDAAVLHSSWFGNSLGFTRMLQAHEPTAINLCLHWSTAVRCIQSRPRLLVRRTQHPFHARVGGPQDRTHFLFTGSTPPPTSFFSVGLRLFKILTGCKRTLCDVACHCTVCCSMTRTVSRGHIQFDFFLQGSSGVSTITTSQEASLEPLLPNTSDIFLNYNKNGRMASEGRATKTRTTRVKHATQKCFVSMTGAKAKGKGKKGGKGDTKGKANLSTSSESRIR